MDSRQISYLIALALVTVLARKSWRMTAAMWLNAVLTLAAMLFVDLGKLTPMQGVISTGVADLIAASLLICIGGRAIIVALLYSLMTPSYFAAIAMGVPSYNAYWAAYILGILQLVVVGAGSGSGGLGVGLRSFSGFAANGLRYLRVSLAGMACILSKSHKALAADSREL